MGLFTLTFGGALRSWGLRKSYKIHENAMSFQYLKKSEKVGPRSPTGVKMTPKTTSPTPNR